MYKKNGKSVENSDVGIVFGGKGRYRFEVSSCYKEKKLMEGYMNVHFHPIPFFAFLNRDFTGFFSHNFLESNRKALLNNNKQPAKL